MFRKKSKYDVAREQLEESLHELISQAFEQGEQLRQLIAERAPVVRDRIADDLPDMEDLRERFPEFMEKSIDRLPDAVTDYLPEPPKPKRKRSKLKKVVFFGAVTAGGIAVAAVLMDRNSGGSYEFDAPPVPRTAPTASTTPASASAEPLSSQQSSSPAQNQTPTQAQNPTGTTAAGSEQNTQTDD